MADLSLETVSHLSRLARLDLSEEERGRFAGQLSSVVAYIEQLQDLGSEHVDPAELSRGASGLSNVMAADRPRGHDDPAAVSAELLLQGAPAQEEGLLVVRAVLGEEGGGA